MFKRALVNVIKRECLLAFRRRSEYWNPLFFFVLVAIMFPLAMSPDPMVLKSIGPGVIWVAALLASLLALPSLFQQDYQDGSLEQLLLTPFPLSGLIFVKILTQWLMIAGPLIIVSPLLASLYHLSFHSTWVLTLSLLLGTPTLFFIGAIGAGLTVGLRQAGLLLALILMPLYIPTLIFGAGAVMAAEMGKTVTAEFSLLAAILILAATLAPFAASAALRIGIDIF